MSCSPSSSSSSLGRKARRGPLLLFRATAAAAAAALLLLCVASPSTSVASAAAAPSPIAADVFLPPAWTHNKTEWRSRLYNSLRLTPWQVRLLEGALDARDALKAPLTLAADAAVLAVANATFAAKRASYNSTFQRTVVAPLEQAANETSLKVEKARVSALNKTELALRAGAALLRHGAMGGLAAGRRCAGVRGVEPRMLQQLGG